MIPEGIPCKYSQLDTPDGMGAGHVKLAPLWNHMQDAYRRQLYCVQWCALNTAVQVVAAMPGVQAYLQQLCSRGHSTGLKLHTALREQLERMAIAHREGKATSLVQFLPAMDGVQALSELCKRDDRHVLKDHVGVYKVLNGLCCALHSEFVACFSEESSYWCGMLACTSLKSVKCDVGSGCGRPREGTCTAQFQPVQTFYCALSPANGSSQTAATVIMHDSFGRIACEKCGKGALMTKNIKYSHLPMVLLLNTYAQQADHDEAHAHCSDRKVGLKFQAQMVLQDDKGPVSYRLTVITFREGELNGGHFFIAAPTKEGLWRVMNSEKVSMPMSLMELQRAKGRQAHGMMYVRTNAPAQDDWACLNPTGSMQTPVNEFRPLKVGTASKSLSEEEVFEQQLEQAIQASLAQQGAPQPHSLHHPAPPPPQPTPATSDRGMGPSKSSRVWPAQAPPRPVDLGTASKSDQDYDQQQLELAIKASLAHQDTPNPQSLPHPAPPPPQPTPAMSDRGKAPSKSSRPCKARPPPRPVKASSGPSVPWEVHQQQLQQASLADEGAPPPPPAPRPLLQPTPGVTGRGQALPNSSRPWGELSRPVKIGGASHSPAEEACQQQLQQALPISLAQKGALFSSSPSSSPPSSPPPPPPAAAKKEVAAARPQASRASKAGRLRANRQPAALQTIADLERQDKAVPAGFRQPAAKSQKALSLKSEEDLLAEVAADAGLQDKLISAKHGSADTAVGDRYTVSQDQRAHQPMVPDTAVDSMAAERARLLAVAAARADAKTAAEQHAAAVTAGGKGGKKGKKVSKAVTAPEQKNAVQAEVKGQVAACQAQQLPADTAKGDASATATAPAAELGTRTEAEAQAAAEVETAQAPTTQAQGLKEPAAKITAPTATKSETRAEVEAPAAADLKAAEAQAQPLKHAEATTQAQAKAAKRARTKAAKATAKQAQAANAKAPGGGPVAQAQAEAAASSATPKLPTTQKSNTGNTATSAPLNTKQRMEGPQQGTTTSQQIPGNPSKSGKPQKGSSLEQKPAAGTAICSQQQPAKTPATQEQTIKHSTSQPAVNAQAGAHTVSKAQAVPAKAAKARAGQAGAAKATATQVLQAAAASADAVKPDAQAPAAAMSYTRAAVVASRHDKPQTSISHAWADEVKAMSQDQAACEAEHEANAAGTQPKAANDAADAVRANANASAAAESDAEEQVAAGLKAAAATAQAQTLKETTAATKAQAKAAKRARTKAAKATAKQAQAANAKAAGGGQVAQAQAEAAVSSATAEAHAVAELKAEEAKAQAQTQALAQGQAQAQAQGEDEAQAQGEAKAAPAAAILAKAANPEAAQRVVAAVKAAEAAAAQAQLQAAVDATAPAAAVTETKAEMVAPADASRATLQHEAACKSQHEANSRRGKPKAAEAQQKAADDAAITIKADASAPATAEADTKAEPEMLAGTELKAAKARAQASASTTREVQAKAAHAKTVQAKAARAKAPETNQIQGGADMFAEHRAHSRNPKPPGKGRWRRWGENALKGTLAVGAGMLLASAVHKVSKRA